MDGKCSSSELAEGGNVAAVSAELVRVKDQLATAKALIIECLRLLTPEQYAELRQVTGDLDMLGGFSGEPGS